MRILGVGEHKSKGWGESEFTIMFTGLFGVSIMQVALLAFGSDRLDMSLLRIADASYPQSLIHQRGPSPTFERNGPLELS